MVKKGDFKKVFEFGHKFSSRHLVIYAVSNGLVFSRLGISVSRKVGSAVVRNRIKRRLREAVRKQLQHFPLQCDMVIAARKAAAGAGFPELDGDVAVIFSRLANEGNCNSVHQDI